MSRYVSAALRREVINRAGNCSEYCRISQQHDPFTFHVEHVVAVKHRGETISINLCLSCMDCNEFKGTDLGSIDVETGKLTPLFNPRQQNWDEHFRLNGAIIEPITPEGRVTVFLLQFNATERVEFRAGLISLNQYPCKS